MEGHNPEKCNQQDFLMVLMPQNNEYLILKAFKWVCWKLAAPNTVAGLQLHPCVKAAILNHLKLGLGGKPGCMFLFMGWLLAKILPRLP